MMRRKKRQPPAKKRYDEKHPVVSVRLPRELKEFLDNHKENKSYAEMVKEGLENAAKLQEQFEKGYEKGRRDFEIWVYCSECGRRGTVIPNSEVHEMIIEFLADKVACAECIKSREMHSMELFDLMEKFKRKTK